MKIHGLKFLQRVSFFNYAYTALAENELVGRRLEKFPVSRYYHVPALLQLYVVF